MNKEYPYQPFSAESEDLLRAERLSSEWLEVEKALDEAGINDTVVFFGSARILDKQTSLALKQKAQQQTAANPESRDAQSALKLADIALEQSRYYEEARELAKQLAKHLFDCGEHHTRLVTGGGPGIMEAANRGAADAGQDSIGLNITIPTEQIANPYVPDGLSFEFHYFSLRKMHFLKRASAIIVFPGGFGTLDELCEVLTLIQTGKIPKIPVILYDKAFWDTTINFEYIANQQLISSEDLSIFIKVNDVAEAFSLLQRCSLP